MVEAKIDILIPVYNEGENIVRVLSALGRAVKTPFRVLICYDDDDDNTLAAIRALDRPPCAVEFVKNRGKGAHGAVLTGFAASRAPAVIVYPADDDYNPPILDRMVAEFEAGCDIVAASRFMPGGTMQGCPWLKAALVRTAAFTMHYVAGIPTRDSTNGFRLFSRRVLEQIPITSTEGFTYSIELLVKSHKRGFRIGEVPAQWFERKAGTSRFRVLKWLPAYLQWFFYAFVPGPVALRK